MLPDEARAAAAAARAAAARAAAAAEGLELVPSFSCETGFKDVAKEYGKYVARFMENCKRYHLGKWTTPEEAALSYARHLGAERAAAEAAAARAAASPLTADEIWAAAAAEGLELVPACNEAGFKSVVEHYGKYATRVRDDGKLRHLGSFATPEEAALCYARHVGAERAAAEAAVARAAEPEPLTADEAIAAAVAEGLELVPSSSTETGFRFVFKNGGRYVAKIMENGRLRHLGRFATSEEAALRYARHIGAERAAAEAAQARGKGPQPLTADEARAAAAAEGLELVPSSSNETGFKGVAKHPGGYKVQSCENRKQRYLGSFATPEEAALCYARYIGAERSAAEAAEAAKERAAVYRPLTADEVRAAAAAEGLELVPSFFNVNGFRGVRKNCGRYVAKLKENGKCRYLGNFNTPEEAALCYARYIGAERAAAEAAEARIKGRPLTADEARAAAAAEGLELVPSSSSETGFKGVCKSHGKYRVEVWDNFDLQIKGYGKMRHLGTFATPEEAALCYARHIAAERAAAGALEAMSKAPQPLSADEARGTKLLRMRLEVGDRIQGKYQGQIGGRNWFDGVVTAVHEDGTCDLHYDDGDHEERVAPRFIKTIAKEEAEEPAEPEEPEEVEVMAEPSESQGASGASNRQLKRKVLSDRGAGGSDRFRNEERRDPHGTFTEPSRNLHRTFREEPQNRLARYLHNGKSEMLPDEARAAATAEGLELVHSMRNETGFKGVAKHPGGYKAQIVENGKQRYLGRFVTAEEAALCYARHGGAERSAAEAAQARLAGPRPLTPDEARAAAAAEGLELVPSPGTETGFRGVFKKGGRYAAQIWEKGKLRHLAMFATPEEAALCYARHVRSERAKAGVLEAMSKAPQPLSADEARGTKLRRMRLEVGDRGQGKSARGEGLEPLMAEEARAAAAAEGLQLVPSLSNETGFKGVVEHYGKYQGQIYENGKLHHLGTFATPEEAALCYARHIGSERAKAGALEAMSEAPQPLSADEARAAAAAEGLELVPSSSNETGFKGVHKGWRSLSYVAKIYEDGKMRHLGTFATPEEAALRYARHIGAERAAAEAAQARGEGPQPLTADEARAAAAAEGLELVPSSGTRMGFKNVHKHREKFMARIKENGQLRHLGMFATPEEAALRYARHVGPVRAAAEAAAARGEGPKWPLRGKGPPQITTAEEILAATAAEGLELVPSSTNETGFKNVWKNDDGKYASHVRENGKLHYLGIFATPEEAALCYARHIGAERAAAEAAAARGEGPQSLTADEARAAAAAEGLELVPSSSNETGFRGVFKNGGRYQARIMDKCKARHLGSFATPEEASLILSRYIRDLVDGWLIPGRRPSHRPPPRAPVPAPPTRSEVEQAEALRCWHLLLTAMREDRRKQQGSTSSSAPPPPSPAATTKHALRKRPAAAVAFAEVGVSRAEALQPQLTAKSGDDPGAARCVICLEALDLSAASSRGEAACGHTPCCGNYFHKRCLSQWLQGSGQSDNDPLPIKRIEKKCPTCRQDLLTRALIPGPSQRRPVASTRT
eukprot:jgi/Chrpa1/7863/Chrysochromulina_OHIO_Genome00016453-RA